MADPADEGAWRSPFEEQLAESDLEDGALCEPDEDDYVAGRPAGATAAVRDVQTDLVFASTLNRAMATAATQPQTDSRAASSGWPLRADRPDCRRWALQVGAEVDATRVSFGPHLTEEADHVLVQSHEARRALCAAGREAGSVSVAARAIAASLEALVVCEDADVAALPRQSVEAAAHPKTAIRATSARQRREPARA